MKNCSVEFCLREAKQGTMCRMHAMRKYRTGTVGGAERVRPEVATAGYISKVVDGKRRNLHQAVAEAALGHPLPVNAEVHHIDENKFNNSPENLVICPNHAYHALLHVRQRAMDACGNPNWIKCRFCKQHDDPKNIAVTGRNYHHNKCAAAYARDTK